MIYTKFFRIYVVDGIFLQNSCFDSIPGQQTGKWLMNFISTDLVKTLYFVKCEIKLSKKLSPDWEYKTMCYIGTAASIWPLHKSMVTKCTENTKYRT